MTTLASSEARPNGKLAARWFGNVFLGIAVGLLAYYGITDLVTSSQQRELRANVPAAALGQTVTQEGPPLDFSEWESEDLAYWNDLPTGQGFGRLVAPAIELDTIVVKGVSPANLKRGPGWMPYSDPPGATGNCGISGHRTTYGAPFRRLDELKPGDTIEFHSPYRLYEYRVQRVFAVRPNQVEVVESTEKPMLTLTACHPPYSAKYRLIVQSELVEVRRFEPAP